MTTTESSLLIECSECTHKYSRRAEKCPKCGAILKVSCNICQSKIPSNSMSCPECGDPKPFEAIDIDESQDEENQKLNQKKTTDTHTSQKLREEGNLKSSERSSETLYSEESQVEENTSKLTVGQILWSYKGRISRKQFWCFGVPIFVAFGAIYLLNESQRVSQSSIILYLLLILPLVWSGYAIQVKRWHDRNRSGFWVFINLIPIVGILVPLIELGFLKGTQGYNRYGNDPLENTHTLNKVEVVRENSPTENKKPETVQITESIEEELESDCCNESFHQQNKVPAESANELIWLFGAIIVVCLIAFVLMNSS